MREGIKITMTPEDEAFFAAAQEFEPSRTIAERIASKYGVGWSHQLVDDISHALEDAIEQGRKLAPFDKRQEDQ